MVCVNVKVLISHLLCPKARTASEGCELTNHVQFVNTISCAYRYSAEKGSVSADLKLSERSDIPPRELHEILPELIGRLGRTLLHSAGPDFRIWWGAHPNI